MFRDKESRLPVLCLAWLLQATSTLSQVDQKKRGQVFLKKGLHLLLLMPVWWRGNSMSQLVSAFGFATRMVVVYPPPCLAAASSPLPTTNPSGVGVVVQLLPPFS